MNNLRNSIRLIGNLGANPEIKDLPSGKRVAKINLATNDQYKNNEGKLIKETQWHNLVVWGKPVNFVEKYLEKGNEVAVEGRLLNRTYTDKEGNKKFTSEVVVNEIMKIGSKKVDLDL